MISSGAQSVTQWPLAVYLALCVALIGIFLILSHYLGQRHREYTTAEVYESGVSAIGFARFRLSAKFYLIAMFFVIFDLEAMFIFAWAVAFRESGWPGYVEILIFVFILLAALAYLWRMGALDWGPQSKRTSTARHTISIGANRTILTRKSPTCTGQ
jgi:NADH-quinone oxidoreductase subunit A